MEDELLVEPPNFYGSHHIFDMSFHPTSDYLAFSDIKGNATILAYNNSDTKEVFKQQIFDNSARCVLFSPEGNSLAVGAKSGDVKILDQNGQQKLHLHKAHS